MLDFVIVSKDTASKRDTVYLRPNFIIKNGTKDLMIRGRDFYAVWNEETGLWSTNEDDVIRKVDTVLKEEKKACEDDLRAREDLRRVVVKYMWDSSSGSIDAWHKYCQRQMRDNFQQLDSKIVFADEKTKKEDYASKKLSYSLSDGDCPAYTELMSTLYAPEEREKLEWAVGAVLTGDAREIQKFIVIYGEGGTGKSTFLDILEQLTDGYHSAFKSEELTSANNQFALEDFKGNPLVSIDHEGDLSRVQDNTKLNSIVSHDKLVVNEKFKAKYEAKFNTFLFIGTNKPVRITDAKSGLIRRLIDVYPSNRKLPAKRYFALKKQVKYELGAIAKHCIDVYTALGDDYFDDYSPSLMLQTTNDFYNFMEDQYDLYKKENRTTLKAAWAAYKRYCDMSSIQHPLNFREFRSELKNYFRKVEDRVVDTDGEVLRSVYSDFIFTKFNFDKPPEAPKEAEKVEEIPSWLNLTSTVSLFEQECKDCPAQYFVFDEEKNDYRLERKWVNNKKKLSDIDTTQLHAVKLPADHIVIDFDSDSLEDNIREASKWPETYAELSKSGKKIHLHYIYEGDPNELDPIFAPNIEQKVWTGDSSLRRKFSRCNTSPIRTISSGLKLKEKKEGEKNMLDTYKIQDEIHLRNLIRKALNKEISPGKTICCVDFICNKLTEAYESGIKYDVTDMESKIMNFCLSSTNHAQECLTKFVKAPLKSKDEEEPEQMVEVEIRNYDEAPIVFYDIECFPNLFIVCWKYLGDDTVVRMINPSPSDIEKILSYRLIGFNNTGYDDSMLYARYCGADNLELFNLSKRIIANEKDAKIREARNLSYTDVYDFCSKKQGLKKWEIELGIHHKELGLEWDKPVPEDMWDLVAEYCANDVVATEAVFVARESDYKIRLVLVDLANAIRGEGSTPRDSTNTLTTKLIVGNEKEPWKQFVYPNLSERFHGYEFCQKGIDPDRYISRDVIVKGWSYYKGYDPGEGGFVFAKPGMYAKVRTFDVASMHPSSLIAENGFGPFTQNFKNLLDLRLAIKHKDYETARHMFGGIVAKYLESDEDAKALSNALKIAINSVYGLTAAHFDNKLRDPRNEDNWVAKRGALFMIDLMLKVQDLGYTVVHVKTDSIKVVDPDERITNFIVEMGKEYGYTFEVEAEYERFCLVNDSTYIARYSDSPANGKEAGQWTATGKEFAVPYVFKTLFSKEPIVFDDLCTTMTCRSAFYLDMNEDQDKLRNYLENGKSDNQIDRLTCEETKNGLLYHDFIFVGKAGRFVPIKAGYGGGILLREENGKYVAAVGTKKKTKRANEEPVYRFLEAEVALQTGKDQFVNMEYWEEMAAASVKHIEQFGTFDFFVNADIDSFAQFMNPPLYSDTSEVPFD